MHRGAQAVDEKVEEIKAVPGRASAAVQAAPERLIGEIQSRANTVQDAARKKVEKQRRRIRSKKR